ncbi:MAG TPA: AMP-binding protein [Acidobacteriaceae bacterium]|jgi:long-subunit acyl-CoA synthetase (AMP-forming)/1-acyl-sn-glycerol-3-phosphate acyltransferase/acyl carrier protein
MRANLATLVEDFRRHSAETAVVAHRGNRRYATTYGELASLAGRFAAELERRGIGAGDRVVIWGENSAEWMGVFFGCVLRAVIAVPLDAAGAAEFAARVIEDTRPKLVVGDAALLAGLEAVGGDGVPQGLKPDLISREGMPGLKSGPIQGEAEAGPAMLPLAGIGERLPAEAMFEPSAAIGAHTPFQIVFTSGTTSEPRGIVHTHRNILVTLDPIEREMRKYMRYERVFHPLRFLHSLPLSHVFGQFMALWVPGLLAAEVHFSEHLEPSRITELIRRERISVLIAVPRVLHLLRVHLLGRFPGLGAEVSAEQKPPSSIGTGLPRAEARSYSAEFGMGVQGAPLSEARDGSLGALSAGVGGAVGAVLKRWWRYRRVHGALGWKFWAVISGGATLPAELETFWNRLGYALIQGYGMTETAALVTLNHPFHIKEGTIGKPMPGHEVKLTAEGEILVRGDMLTEATWQGGAMHKREGEWLATGDLAEANDSGELRFLGRKGDVIVTGAGMNIHPADLETALAAQRGVRAAVVVGCEMPAGTEAVAVVLFAGTDAELDAAVTAANRGLAEYQQMRRVLRWPELELPYTSTGKLLRRKVAEWAGGVVRKGIPQGLKPLDSRAEGRPKPEGLGYLDAPGASHGKLESEGLGYLDAPGASHGKLESEGLGWLDAPGASHGKLGSEGLGYLDAPGASHGKLGAEGLGWLGTPDELLRLIAEVTGEEVPQGLKPGSVESAHGTAEAVPLTEARAVDALRLSEDLRLDSLGRVQLQSALEQRFSVELEDDAVGAVETVGELRALMGRELAATASAGAGDRRAFGLDVAVSYQLSAIGDEGSAVRDAETTGNPRVALPFGQREPGAPDSEHVYARWPWSWPVQALRAVWVECVMRPLVWLLAAPRVRYVEDPTLSPKNGDKDGAPELRTNEPGAPKPGAPKPRTPELRAPDLRRALAAHRGPLLIICNHITSYDGAFVLYALPGRLRRHVAAAMSGEMLQDYRRRRNQPNAALNLLAPAVYWLLTALFNVFPLPRGRGFRRSFAHAGEAMDRGYSVLLFPEGTRSTTGHMNRFRPGIGLLAEESRVAILPVGLVGLYEEAGSWFHAGRVEVHVGELIPAADDATDAAELAARLERAVRGLVGADPGM